MAADTFIDPSALMRIKSLQMRARVVVEGFYSGLHRSPYHGFSVEFSEYRQYTPGDDPRYIDWRLFARSDRHYIKRFEDETNLRCYLAVDQSRSMNYSSGDFSKAEYAATLAATLAYFLMKQRDAVGVMTFDREIADYLPPRYRAGHLHRLMTMLERSSVGEATDLTAPLEQLARLVSKRGVIVLISDFLAPPESLRRYLGELRSRGHEVLLFRVLDPAEMDFSFEDSSLFYDLESGQELYVDPQTIRDSYLQKFQQHGEELEALCGDLGADIHVLRTDRPLEWSLFDWLQTRMQRGDMAVRRGAMRTSEGAV